MRRRSSSVGSDLGWIPESIISEEDILNNVNDEKCSQHRTRRNSQTSADWDDNPVRAMARRLSSDDNQVRGGSRRMSSEMEYKLFGFNERSSLRRLSGDWDERKLEEKRSKKMSVSTFITDGRGIRRLSSTSASDALEIRERKRSDCCNFVDGERSHNSLFAPQRIEKNSTSSIVNCMFKPQKKLEDTPSGIQYNNTYIIDDCSYIDLTLIKHIINETLYKHFKGKKYSLYKSTMGSYTKDATNEITAAVKKFHLNRYKVVSIVTVAQNIGQGITKSSRCLWNGDSGDTWTDAFYRNSTLIASGTVFMTYFE